MANFNLNGGYGIPDYGYSTDQALLSFMDSNFHGGTIYSTTPIGFLDPALKAHWTWVGGEIGTILSVNPTWAIVSVKSVTILQGVEAVSLVSGGGITVIGPYLAIERGNYTLSSVIQMK